MTPKDRNILRDYQRIANLGLDDREKYLEEVTPRDEKQAKVIAFLKDLLNGRYRTVVLCGTEGSGKTYLSCAAINSALKTMLLKDNSNMVTGPRYIMQRELDMMFRSAMHEEGNSELKVFNNYAAYSLLVIDEIGRSNNSQYSLDNIELLISKRYSFHKPTVLITNDSAEELRNMFDRHILDRLAKKGATFELDTESQR